MNITFFESDETERAFFSRALKKHTLSFHNRPFTSRDLPALAKTQVLCLFIYSKITARDLEKLPSLALIVTLSTGYDHIDVAACNARGITVCNIPKYGGTAVAEHTFALMLALARHLPRAIQNSARNRFSLHGLCGTELAGKTLGVIGAGAIGSAVISRASAFDMRILVHERTPNKALERDPRVTHVTLSSLFKHADIITLHVPYTKETHHIIDGRALAQMKPTAYLINTARGSLIDTSALHKALVTKRIAGAALDVLEGESELKEAHQPRKSQHLESCNKKLLRETRALLNLPNVIITPHMAFYTHEAMHTILTTTVQNIIAFQQKKPLNQIV